MVSKTSYPGVMRETTILCRKCFSTRWRHLQGEYPCVIVHGYSVSEDSIYSLGPTISQLVSKFVVIHAAPTRLTPSIYQT